MAYRILHVLDHSWPVLDGYSQRSRCIVNAQAHLGMKPSVLTGPLHGEDDRSASEIILDGLSYFRTPYGTGLARYAIQKRWPVLRELAVMQLLRRRIQLLLKDQEFDIVHAHSPALCGQAAAEASRSCGVPFVYEIRAFWEDGAVDRNRVGAPSLRYRLARALDTHVLRRADAVVTIARPMVEDLRSRGISGGKIFHIPNGVDVSRFTPRARDITLAAQLQVEHTPTLGFLGTLFPWEGVPWLVRAAAELRKRGVVFKLLIVGDGADAAQVKAAIQETRSSDFVAFLGRVPHEHVDQYYSVMDVLVYPRRSMRLTELVTPLKPLEAMALGKPLLASGVGGIRELIEHDVTGLLFEPGNVDDFCCHATNLLTKEDLRWKLGNLARQKVSKERDWKVIIQQYEAVYEASRQNASTRA